MAIFRRGPPNGGVECRRLRTGRLKFRFSTNMIGNCCTVVCISHLSTGFLFTAGIGRQAPRAIHSHCRPWIVCMTTRLDVTPKTLRTTEQNRIVRTGKSEAEVTNSKKTALEVLYTIEANYWQTQHRAASLRQQSYTCWFFPSSPSLSNLLSSSPFLSIPFPHLFLNPARRSTGARKEL